jgi:hypothetical protein
MGGQADSGPFRQTISADMGESVWDCCPANSTEGRSSVSAEQRENLGAILRQAA